MNEITKKEKLQEIIAHLDEFDHDNLSQLAQREFEFIINQLIVELPDNDLVNDAHSAFKNKKYTESVLHLRCAIEML